MKRRFKNLDEVALPSGTQQGSSSVAKKKMVSAPLVVLEVEDLERSNSSKDGVSVITGLATSPVHPLLIDHIVEKVMGYTAGNAFSEWHWRQQLLSMRLVNWTWNFAAIKLVRELPSSQWRFGYDCSKKMAELTQTMTSSELVPFTKAEFEVNFFTSENTRNLENFFLSPLRSLTHLTITIGQDFSIYFDVKKLKRGLDLSRLKLLSFNVTFFNTMPAKKKKQPDHLSNQAAQLFDFFKLLVESAENLETFEFVFPTGQFGFEADELETQLSDIVCDSLMNWTKTLKHLKLIMFVDDRHLKRIETMRLRNVETLTLNFVGSKVYKQNLESFLGSFSNSLVALRLADADEVRAEDMTFPVMKNLKRFEVKLSHGRSLGFLDSFPNLETIVMRDRRHSRSKWVLMDHNVHKTLREVVLPDRVRSTQLFVKLPTIFPSIRSLSMKMSSDSVSSLHLVFKHLRRLEELCIHFPTFFENFAIDSALTGIPPEKCRDMLSRQSFNPSDIHKCVRTRNLTCMKNLKKLKLTGEKFAVVLTDVTAAFAFLKMPFVGSILCDPFNISTKMIKKLRATSRVNFPNSKEWSHPVEERKQEFRIS